MKSGQGSCSTNRTLYGSTITTSFTFSFSCAPLARSKLNLASSAVNGSPLWNFRPLRRVNSYTSLSSLSRPGFGEARRHALSRHRLHQRVVQREQHPERRHETGLRLARIEPGRRQRHIDRKAHLAFRLGLRRRRGRAPRLAPARTQAVRQAYATYSRFLRFADRRGAGASSILVAHRNPMRQAIIGRLLRRPGPSPTRRRARRP